MKNEKTPVGGRRTNKRYASTMMAYLIKIKRLLKAFEGVFMNVGAGYFLALRRALVCLS